MDKQGRQEPVLSDLGSIQFMTIPSTYLKPRHSLGILQSKLKEDLIDHILFITNQTSLGDESSLAALETDPWLLLVPPQIGKWTVRLKQP